MKIQLDESTRVRAEAVAQQLKLDLLSEIVGRETDAVGCACGGRHNGRAEVIDIEYPSAFGENAHNIGLWSRWSVTLKEKCTAISPYSMSLDDFVGKSKLFTIFRNAFRDVGLYVELPAVFFRSGQKELTQQSSHRHGFTGADRILFVQPGQSKYIRPTSAVSESCWESAKLEITVPATNSLPQVTFCVDPDWLHKEINGDSREYFGGAIGISNLLTVHVAEGISKRDLAIPVARLISYDETTHEHAFELAEGVVEFEPVS